MRKLLSLLLAFVLCIAPLTGCNNGGGNDGGGNDNGGGSAGEKTTIVMWGTGDSEQQAEYTAMRNAFNNSNYAKERNLYLSFVFLSSTNYSQTINQGTASDGGEIVDIIFSDDRTFKNWANQDWIVSLENYMSDEFKDYINDTMWSSIHPRFRLNKKGFTSYEDDPYWGVPIDTSPTALYYNRSAIENAGVIVISVDDEVVTSDNFAGFAGEYEGLTEAMIGSNLIDLWNDNLIADKFGQYHDTCGNRNWEPGNAGKADNATGAGFAADILKTKQIDVPNKGYYREDLKNWLGSGSWANPNKAMDASKGATQYVKVFNASVAMNWDEMEDIGRLLSTKQNDQKYTHGRTIDGQAVATTYGYYTEWWFNYGWSVGGDCLQDTTNEGTWMYGLADWSTNYKVTAAGEGYVGKVTGTVYHEGDTLEFIDKLNVDVYAPMVDPVTGRPVRDDVTNEIVFDGKIVLPNQYGGIDVYDPETEQTTTLATAPVGSYTADSSVLPEITENATDDIVSNPNAMFVELPSTKEAVARYLSNVGKDLGMMPLPDTFDEAGTIRQFGDGQIAFVVERGYQIGMVRRLTEGSFEWGIAPLPQYKEYVDPLSNDTTVKRQGVDGGHSEATALCITKESPYPQLAWQVIEWLTSDYVELRNGEMERAGQIVKAEVGYIPNQPSVANSSTFIKEGEEVLNLDIFFDALEYEEAGDWWYLPDNGWINVWASPLNDQVRNGQMTVEAWFNGYTQQSNTAMLSYSYYYGVKTTLQQVWYNHLNQPMPN